MKKKKSLILAALTALFLTTSCSDDVTDGMPSVPSLDVNSITFTTNRANTTRSAVTAHSVNQFTVTSLDAEGKTYYEDVDYIYDISANVFRSSLPYYWPMNGSLSFYAISNPGSKRVDDNNVPHYSYQNWSAETDLIAATVTAGEKTVPYPLTFRHLTSQAYIMLCPEDEVPVVDYTIKAVRMTTPCNGEYSFPQTTGETGTWTIDNKVKKEYDYNDAYPVTFDNKGASIPSEVYWNILPVADGKIHFEIEYQVKQNGKVIADFTGDNYKVCDIENPNLEPGKRYTFKFYLPIDADDNIITFAMTVTPWGIGDVIENVPQNQRQAECGDIFYSDGTYASPDSPMTGKTPIGMVVYVAESNNDPLCEGKSHGLVMSKGKFGKGIFPMKHDGVSCYIEEANHQSLDEAWNDNNGVRNTELLVDFCKENASNVKKPYIFNIFDDWRKENPVPSNTSGWFIPTLNQFLTSMRKTAGFHFQYQNFISGGDVALRRFLNKCTAAGITVERTEDLWLSTSVDCFPNVGLINNFNGIGITAGERNSSQEYDSRAFLAF